jgi:PAS domain S-box-containing protein
LLTVFVLAAMGIVLVGAMYFDAQRAAILNQVGHELEAVRELKTDQVSAWRSSLLADGRMIAHDPTLSDEMDRWIRNPDDRDVAQSIRARLDSIVGNRGYAGAHIVSPDGTNWIADSGSAAPGPQTIAEARAAMSSTDPTLTDLFEDAATGDPRLDVVTPLFAGAKAPRAALVMRRDPRIYLYPLIQSWPSPSETSEILLVRHGSGSVTYLNSLRFAKEAALQMRTPDMNVQLLAVQATHGPPRTAEGVDYRGKRVIGAFGAVPNSPWLLVAKMDQSEAYASIVSSQRNTLVAVSLLVLLVGAGLGVAWRQRAVAYYKQRTQDERELRLLTEQYDYLTEYANDAVILAAGDERIIRVNQRTSEMYGYDAEELLGMTLADLRSEDQPTWAKVAEDDPSGSGIYEAPQWTKSGKRFEAEISVRMIETREDRQFLAIIRDISERKQAEALLRDSEARFRSIVDSSPTAIYTYSLEAGDRLVLTGANPSADRIIGISHHELVGKTIEEAFPELAATEIPEMYRSVARGELGSQSFEVPYEDDRFSGYYSVTVFRMGPNTIAVDFLDISDRKRAENELRERTDELVRSNAELEKFAYIASHDLQEPLRMVASYTQLLQRRYEGRLDADADDFIGYAVDGASRMQALINELLAYSRVGTQGAPFAKTDLDDVLERVVRALGPALSESGGQVTYGEMPTIVCDPTQMGQVFQNLIANALKFRGHEPPVVRVVAQRGEGEWEFSVKDNGIGIEPEFSDRIFVIFQRLQSRAEYPGTGMGLAICKRIVERHGGKIWVESEPGHGSDFRFTVRDMPEE